MPLARPHKLLDAAELEHWANLYRFDILDTWECSDLVEQVCFWDWICINYPDELDAFKYWFRYEKDSEKQLLDE